jgi:hypothetical protein
MGDGIAAQVNLRAAGQRANAGLIAAAHARNPFDILENGCGRRFSAQAS